MLSNKPITKEEIHELAEHIYDLDCEVYANLGSSLGRVFNRDREKCVDELVELLMTRPDGNLVRSELALIANMARTIPDKEEHRHGCRISFPTPAAVRHVHRKAAFLRQFSRQ